MMLILCVVINFFRLTGRHVPTLTANSIINNMYYGEFKSYATSDILWGVLYDQGIMDTGIHNKNIIGQMFI